MSRPDQKLCDDLRGKVITELAPLGFRVGDRGMLELDWSEELILSATMLCRRRDQVHKIAVEVRTNIYVMAKNSAEVRAIWQPKPSAQIQLDTAPLEPTVTAIVTAVRISALPLVSAICGRPTIPRSPAFVALELDKLALASDFGQVVDMNSPPPTGLPVGPAEPAPMRDPLDGFRTNQIRKRGGPPKQKGKHEEWVRGTGEPEVGGFTVSLLEDVDEPTWIVSIMAMEFISESEVGRELSAEIERALSKLAGVVRVDRDDRERWKVVGKCDGEVIAYSVAVVLDGLSDEIREVGAG
jgi:hypothetical protein